MDFVEINTMYNSRDNRVFLEPFCSSEWMTQSMEGIKEWRRIFYFSSSLFLGGSAVFKGSEHCNIKPIHHDLWRNLGLGSWRSLLLASCVSGIESLCPNFFPFRIPRRHRRHKRLRVIDHAFIMCAVFAADDRAAPSHTCPLAYMGRRE